MFNIRNEGLGWKDLVFKPLYNSFQNHYHDLCSKVQRQFPIIYPWFKSTYVMLSARKNIVWHGNTAVRTTINTTWKSIQVNINCGIKVRRRVYLFSLNLIYKVSLKKMCMCVCAYLWMYVQTGKCQEALLIANNKGMTQN
jgi:hypothetical protein